MNIRDYPKRFASKIEIDAQTGCWNFSKHAKRRYAAYNYNGKSVQAHRLSWCIANNRDGVPDGLNVCHTCDNTKCVNPAHLWLGTQKDNMQDCSNKGRLNENSRQSPGEDHSLSKLLDPDILEIRRRALSGETAESISKDFCVGKTQIQRIITGQRWGHIQEGIINAKAQAPKVKADDFYEIRRRRLSGESLNDVAAAFGVSIATVSRIANGKVKDTA